MLNISENSSDLRIDKKSFHSFGIFQKYRAATILRNILLILFVCFIIIIFLPWTQNISSKGYITTLHPDQRPQTLHSVIPGRIEKWFVREGNYVNKGDTILFISEIKDEYFDPKLLNNTKEQIKAKESKVKSYMEKVRALDAQIDALIITKDLKIKQANNYIKQSRLKIISDSINLVAAKTDFNIAKRQFTRFEKLYEDGIKSLTDLEKRKMKLQSTEAQKISAENLLLTSRNALINAEVELVSIENQYIDKLSKAESNKFAALSDLYEAEAVVTKMQNQYINYSVRSGLYYITAPQDGYITKTIRSGIGETIKEGEELLSIMPAKYDLAVSMFIEPQDLPLMKLDQHVRFRFDGWPSIVFSGWPDLSYGTFGGNVVAIDNFISENGKYRILVVPDPEDKDWPSLIRVGSGARGMALLEDVPIWYELWRQLNGFPPDYYKRNPKIKSIEKEELGSNE